MDTEAMDEGGIAAEASSQAFRYRDKSKVVHDGLLRYFNKKTFSDLTVIDPEGRKIRCHQLVLSACSRRFAEMLDQGRLTGEELPVRGVDALGLYLVIRFFYTGECDMDHTSVIQVYDAAHRLDVPGLATACDVYSQQVLGPPTACSLLQRAYQFAMVDYANTCSHVIRNNFEAATQSDDFLTIDMKTLMGILEDNIPYHSEGSIFRAAWRWGMSSVGHMQAMPRIFQAVKVPNLSMQDLMTLAGPLPGPVPARSRLYADMAPASGQSYGAECADALPAARLREAQECLVSYMLGGMELVKAVKLTAQRFGLADVEPAPPAAPCPMLHPGGGPMPYCLPPRGSGAGAAQPPAPAAPTLIQQPQEPACRHGRPHGALLYAQPQQAQQQRPADRHMQGAPSHPATSPAMPAPAWQPGLAHHRDHHQRQHHHHHHQNNHHQGHCDCRGALVDAPELDWGVENSFAASADHQQDLEELQEGGDDAQGRPLPRTRYLHLQQEQHLVQAPASSPHGQRQAAQEVAAGALRGPRHFKEPQGTAIGGSAPSATAISGTAGSRERQDDAVSGAVAAPAGDDPHNHDLDFNPDPEEDNVAGMHLADPPLGLELPLMQQQQLQEAIKQLSAGEIGGGGGKVLLVIDPAQLLGNAQHAVKVIRATADPHAGLDKMRAPSAQKLCQVDSGQQNPTSLPEVHQRGQVDASRRRKRGRYEAASVPAGPAAGPSRAAEEGQGVEANPGAGPGATEDAGAAVPEAGGAPVQRAPSSRPQVHLEVSPVMPGQPSPTSVGNRPKRGRGAMWGIPGMRGANNAGRTPSSICSGGWSPRSGRAGTVTAGRAMQAQAAGQGQRQQAPHPGAQPRAETGEGVAAPGGTMPSPLTRPEQQQAQRQRPWQQQDEPLTQQPLSPPPPQQQLPAAEYVGSPAAFGQGLAAPHRRREDQQQHRHQHLQQQQRQQAAGQGSLAAAVLVMRHGPPALGGASGTCVANNQHHQAPFDPADPRPRLPAPAGAAAAAAGGPSAATAVDAATPHVACGGGGTTPHARPLLEHAAAALSSPCPPAAPCPAPDCTDPAGRAAASAAAPVADAGRPAPAETRARAQQPCIPSLGPATQAPQRHHQPRPHPHQSPPQRIETSPGGQGVGAALAPLAARPPRGAQVTKLIVSTVPLKPSSGVGDSAAPVAVIQLRSQPAHKLFPPASEAQEAPAGSAAPARPPPPLPAPAAAAASIPCHRRRSSAPSHMSTTADVALLASEMAPPRRYPPSPRGCSMPGRLQVHGAEVDASRWPPTGQDHPAPARQLGIQQQQQQARQLGLQQQRENLQQQQQQQQQQCQQAPQDRAAAPSARVQCGAAAAAAAAAPAAAVVGPQSHAPGQGMDEARGVWHPAHVPTQRGHHQHQHHHHQQPTLLQRRIAQGGCAECAGAGTGTEGQQQQDQGYHVASAGGNGVGGVMPPLDSNALVCGVPAAAAIGAVAGGGAARSALPASPSPLSPPSERGPVHWHGPPGADPANGTCPQQQLQPPPLGEQQPRLRPQPQQQQQQRQQQQPPAAGHGHQLDDTAELQRARVVALRQAALGEQLQQLWSGAVFFVDGHQGGSRPAYGSGGTLTAGPHAMQQSVLAHGGVAGSAVPGAAPQGLMSHQCGFYYQQEQQQHHHHHAHEQHQNQLAHADPQPHPRHSRSQPLHFPAAHLSLGQGGSDGRAAAGVQEGAVGEHPLQGTQGGHPGATLPTGHAGAGPSAASPPVQSLRADATPTAVVGSAGTPPPPPPPPSLPLPLALQGAPGDGNGGGVSSGSGAGPGGTVGPTISGNAAVSSFDNRLVRELAHGLRVSVNGGCSYGELNELVTPGSNGMFDDTGLISPNTELFNILNATNGVDDTVGPMLDLLVTGESVYDDTANTNPLAGAANRQQ